MSISRTERTEENDSEERHHEDHDNRDDRRSRRARHRIDERLAAPTQRFRPQAASASPEAEKKFSSIEDFLNHYKGQSLANSQGGYQGECVSLISRALEEVHGVDHGAWGDAIDYQSGGSGGQRMKQNGFTWHTDQKFENGDILVWGTGNDTSAYGHIGIYYEGQVWHQNFNNDRTLHTYDGLIDGYLGYWRA